MKKRTELELKLAELLFLAIDELYNQGCREKADFLMKEIGKQNKTTKVKKNKTK